ncbi:unnamed protein product [Sphenostylis stenocarpa]|uniref:Uncharacterized protein n=1 Tax=Sphenostylis stenocarpa TaxID=92480 RepID=A0AA86S2D5_9FABA|nr:unnamed protein product [Sphenostylis stenocarpa]
MRMKRHFSGTLLNFFLRFFILKLLFQLSLLQQATTQAKKIGGKQKGFDDEMRDSMCSTPNVGLVKLMLKLDEHDPSFVTAMVNFANVNKQKPFISNDKIGTTVISSE